MSVKHLSPLPSLGNIWKWTETFLSRRCMTLYNSAKNCSVIHKIELDLDIIMIILYISSVNATSVKKNVKKMNENCKYLEFYKSMRHNCRKLLGRTQDKTWHYGKSVSKFVISKWNLCKKMETTNNWNGSTCKRHNSVDNWSIVPKNRTVPWYYDKSVN